MVETTLSDGPVYFNVFPNITESLSDPRLSDMLFLNAKVKDFEKLPEGPRNIVVMYRVCYKVIKRGLGTRALLESPSGRTVFFLHTDNALDQRVTEWDEVRLPENWPPPPPGMNSQATQLSKGFPFFFEGS